MELKIIDVDAAEYQEVLQLRQQVLRLPLGMNLFDEDLSEDRDQYIIVAIKDDRLIGCLMIKILDKVTVKFRQMAVHAEFQSKGIGSMIMFYAENFCMLNEYQKAELHARKSAIDFYNKLNYRMEGDEFEEVGIPHYKMVKDLRS